MVFTAGLDDAILELQHFQAELAKFKAEVTLLSETVLELKTLPLKELKKWDKTLASLVALLLEKWDKEVKLG